MAINLKEHSTIPKYSFELAEKYRKIKNRLGRAGTYFSLLLLASFTVLVIRNFTDILNFALQILNLSKYILPDFNINLQPLEDVPLQHITETDNWHRVTDNIYVYSAFMDTRQPNVPFLRVIGGIRMQGAELNDLKCLIKFNFSIVEEVVATNEILLEHHNEKSRAVYFYCNLNSTKIPDYAAIVLRNFTETGNTSWIQVHSLDNNSKKPSIGVCVRPIYNYTDVFGIAEFVAYYEALGVSHFTFYMYTGVTRVSHFLRDLKKNNYSIDILPWSLPANLRTLHIQGQIVSINDCIYRQMNKFTYTAVVDLDEFITPRHGMGLYENLKKFDVPKKQYGSFVVRSSLFCDEFLQDPLPEVIRPFRTQKGIRRQRFIYPFFVRSKYIAKTSKIEMAGVHRVWKHIQGYRQYLVSAEQVLLNHYRSGLCSDNNKTGEMEVEVDVESRKYLNQLMRSTSVKVWRFAFSNDFNP